MFLLALRATYQVWTVALQAGLYTYKALEPTAITLRSIAAAHRQRSASKERVRTAVSSDGETD
jgi:hypothetical protein